MKEINDNDFNLTLAVFLCPFKRDFMAISPACGRINRANTPGGSQAGLKIMFYQEKHIFEQQIWKVNGRKKGFKSLLTG